MLHAPEAFNGKALKDAAVVIYCKYLITLPLDASGSARRVKIFLIFSNCVSIQTAPLGNWSRM